MPKISKILLPVDLPITSLGVVHQAVTLARHFQAEIVVLYARTRAADVGDQSDNNPTIAKPDLPREIKRVAQENHDESLGRELDGIHLEYLTIEGDPAKTIVQAAQNGNADLIMMPSYGPVFDQFLLGSPIGKVLYGTECPVWTASRDGESHGGEFVIRKVLCAVDFNGNDRKTARWAADLAAEFGANLTLAHVTEGVEFWGPGGHYVNQHWKDALVGNASDYLAALQKDLGIKAEIFIGSGSVPRVLHEAVEKTNADLLVIGCRPYGGQLRTHGYNIISAVSVPVVSV